jgi:hypothetical protein
MLQRTGAWLARIALTISPTGSSPLGNVCLKARMHARGFLRVWWDNTSNENAKRKRPSVSPKSRRPRPAVSSTATEYSQKAEAITPALEQRAVG